MKPITRSSSFPIRPNNRPPQGRKTRSSDAGFTMVVLIIAVTVLVIGFLSVLPSIYQEARREHEEELIFRGQQYARAIYLFQQHFNRYPNSVKELVHTNNLSFLRKPWPDPMTPGGKWRFIHVSPSGALLDSWTQGPQAGASPFGQNGSAQNGVNGQNGQPGANGGSANSIFGGPSSSGSASSSQGFGGFGGSSSSSGGGGFGGAGGASGQGGSGSQSSFGSFQSGSGSSQGGGFGSANPSQGGQSGDGFATSSNGGFALVDSSAPGGTSTAPGNPINSSGLPASQGGTPSSQNSATPGRPVDENGKPKKSPDCTGGASKGGSSSSPSSPSSSTSSSSSSSSAFSSSSSSPSSFSSSSSSSSLSSSGFALGNGPVGLGIAGVASCDDAASLRIWNKHKHYDEWEFLGVGFTSQSLPANIPVAQPNTAGGQGTQGATPGQNTGTQGQGLGGSPLGGVQPGQQAAPPPSGTSFPPDQVPDEPAPPDQSPGNPGDSGNPPSQS